MELKDLELVTELKRELETADGLVKAFKAAPGPTVAAQAIVSGAGFGRTLTVDLLPVDKDVAVSAAERRRSKVVAQLQSLGVEVS